jgi:hypothetical protein
MSPQNNDIEHPKPLLLVPLQQASLERNSKETRHDIGPKIWTIVNNRFTLL